MLLTLRFLFALILASMLWVTTWASLQCPLFAVPREVYSHPWFIATLCDTYWGFATFFVWVWYRQTSGVSRLAWFVAIMLLGNIAMASYCLGALYCARRDAPLADLLTRRHDGADLLGPALAVLGVVVIGVAWRTT